MTQSLRPAVYTSLVLTLLRLMSLCKHVHANTGRPQYSLVIPCSCTVMYTAIMGQLTANHQGKKHNGLSPSSTESPGCTMCHQTPKCVSRHHDVSPRCVTLLHNVTDLKLHSVSSSTTLCCQLPQCHQDFSKVCHQAPVS